MRCKRRAARAAARSGVSGPSVLESESLEDPEDAWPLRASARATLAADASDAYERMAGAAAVAHRSSSRGRFASQYWRRAWMRQA